MNNKGAFGIANQGDSSRPVLRPEPQGSDNLTPVPVLTRDIVSRLGSSMPSDATVSMPAPPQESPLQALSRRMAAKAPATPAAPPTPAPVPAEAPRGRFVLGKRPEPTGPRAHELWNDPEMRAKLAEVVGQWEEANPGRKLKATHLVQVWNASHPQAPLNEARARTLKAKIDRAQREYVASQVAGYMASGAKKAVLK